MRECERQWLIEENVVDWRIVCREWRHYNCVFVENGWLVDGDFGVILKGEYCVAIEVGDD